MAPNERDSSSAEGTEAARISEAVKDSGNMPSAGGSILQKVRVTINFKSSASASIVNLGLRKPHR